jgi:hypothetical protein
MEEFITSSDVFSDRDQTIAALEKYYDNCGKFFAEDTFYEQRMCLFWDMYIFVTDFLSSDGVKNAVEYVPDALAHCIDEAHFSIFKVKKVKDTDLIVSDEALDEKLVIHKRDHQNFAGMNKSDYIQGFVYQKDDKNYLSHGLIVHPPKARKSIQKLLKNELSKDKFDRLDLLCKLSKIHLRHVRHMHVSPERIYNEIC